MASRTLRKVHNEGLLSRQGALNNIVILLLSKGGGAGYHVEEDCPLTRPSLVIIKQMLCLVALRYVCLLWIRLPGVVPQ